MDWILRHEALAADQANFRGLQQTACNHHIFVSLCVWPLEMLHVHVRATTAMPKSKVSYVAPVRAMLAKANQVE
eukprot:CAMPEP_0185838900 /NCGR_PEP_ID=MMETSP1353-20130828/13754_1 /TAXON_ID=1077150 /ORGANISM="Erythrolobus australicus, Strain CCMP3124" /LENGTH=73 /DNA_ID=CAMNT_0028538001 /DNA_START=21 /DNA_END=242 /DNA_ORIENTATION=-